MFAVAYTLPSVIVVIVYTNNPFRRHFVLFFFCFFLFLIVCHSRRHIYNIRRRNDDLRVSFTPFSLCCSNPRFKHVFLSFLFLALTFELNHLTNRYRSDEVFFYILTDYFSDKSSIDKKIFK